MGTINFNFHFFTKIFQIVQICAKVTQCVSACIVNDLKYFSTTTLQRIHTYTNIYTDLHIQIDVHLCACVVYKRVTYVHTYLFPVISTNALQKHIYAYECNHLFTIKILLFI